MSDDASVPTTLRFPSPIYLEPEREYALVFLSPASDKYEMFVATMGQKTVGTTNLPDVQNVVVTKQYIGGSLFKSQNGTIWTPSQYQDLTFKLRKASFVKSGTTTFYNTPIEPGNLNCQKLPSNPIHPLPRKQKVRISSGSANQSALPIGRKVSTGAATDPDELSVTGIIEGRGASITGSEIVSSGSGYSLSPSLNNIPLIPITGSGENATGNFTLNSDGSIASASINATGNSYQIGDVLTIDNSNVNVKRGAGFKIVITAISNNLDTLYLTDVQGQKFANTANLITYGANNNTRALVSPATTVNGDSVLNGELNTGSIFEVTQFNHAHHGAGNIIEINGVKPDTELVTTTSPLTSESTVVSVANTTPFATFGSIPVDRGEALIGEEIVSYVLGTGQLTLTRGILNTTATSHPTGSTIQTYEVSGMPLVGINTTHTLPTSTAIKNARGIDSYHLDVNVTGISTRTDKMLLCFADEKAIGGNTVNISQNHQFSTIVPQFNVITPGNTSRITSTIRTVTGTSADGNEVSFIDQGFEPASLNQPVFLPTPRLVASKINETTRLSGLPKGKSLSLNLSMESEDPNLSPVLDVKNATFILGRNKINNPIGFENYADDNRTNQLENDPHGSIFVSERVDLEQPATSLKVLVAASVQPESDFRVYYRLFSADSSEVSQTYRAFPGFKNLVDGDGDGFGDQIIDLSKNDGRPDKFVKPNLFDRFSEYQFSVDNLEQFSGFVIKIVMISTNESYPVRLKDFRALALA